MEHLVLTVTPPIFRSTGCLFFSTDKVKYFTGIHHDVSTAHKRTFEVIDQHEKKKEVSLIAFPDAALDIYR